MNTIEKCDGFLVVYSNMILCGCPDVGGGRDE